MTANEQLREQIRELFCEQGCLPEEIEQLIDCKVTKRTIQNWIRKYGWVKSTMPTTGKIPGRKIQTELFEILLDTIEQARQNPNANTLYAVIRALTALKNSTQLRTGNKKKKVRSISIKTIKQIEQEILGIRENIEDHEEDK